MRVYNANGSFESTKNLAEAVAHIPDDAFIDDDKYEALTRELANIVTKAFRD